MAQVQELDTLGDCVCSRQETRGSPQMPAHARDHAHFPSTVSRATCTVSNAVGEPWGGSEFQAGPHS